MKAVFLVKKLLKGYWAPVFLIALMVVLISSITRLLLLFKSGTGVDWTILNISGLFGIGFLYDLLISFYFILPIILHVWLVNDKIYSRRWKWITGAALAGIITVLISTQLIPKDFNADLRKIVIGYFIVRFFVFLILTAGGPLYRSNWRKLVLLADVFIITSILLFNAVSEWFFWDEFSTRYNFIAVDYLVYTTEVIGNIRESYPIGWLLAGIFVLAGSISWLLRNPFFRSVEIRPSFPKRSLVALCLMVIPVWGIFFASNNIRKFSSNEYVNELAGNGMFEFGAAFWHNELDFYKFYTTLPEQEAFAILREHLKSPNSSFVSTDIHNIERNISYPAPEKKMNVVLISVESLSAEFMKAFGSTKNITPQLDSLADQSLFFTNLYSSGTRTVRGLEALSLSIPPTPGQSIVKRPDNKNLFSLGSVFRKKGYITQYIYGGDAYFDNMNEFFSNNSYTVIDRSAIAPEDVHYSNIWGVSDEDLFNLVLKQLDNNYSTGKNFFSHVMTVSNHRPFTYPDGRIDIPSSNQSRDGGVKYTDYSIGHFLQEASKKAWFSNTVFVIVADHCAGSAGSSQLPVTGYHIPMLIYSPGNIQPRKVDNLTAQIDIAPTILGLLNFNYRSKFFGKDIFNAPKGNELAFISTYQGLGSLRSGKLVIQSPVKKIEEYTPDFITGKAVQTELTDSLVNQAIAYYQCASWMFKNNRYTQ